MALLSPIAKFGHIPVRLGRGKSYRSRRCRRCPAGPRERPQPQLPATNPHGCAPYGANRLRQDYIARWPGKSGPFQQGLPESPQTSMLLADLATLSGCFERHGPRQSERQRLSWSIAPPAPRLTSEPDRRHSKWQGQEEREFGRDGGPPCDQVKPEVLQHDALRHSSRNANMAVIVGGSAAASSQSGWIASSSK